jgi:hypothetical protein
MFRKKQSAATIIGVRPPSSPWCNWILNLA